MSFNAEELLASLTNAGGGGGGGDKFNSTDLDYLALEKFFMKFNVDGVVGGGGGSDVGGSGVGGGNVGVGDAEEMDLTIPPGYPPRDNGLIVGEHDGKLSMIQQQQLHQQQHLQRQLQQQHRQHQLQQQHQHHQQLHDRSLPRGGNEEGGYLLTPSELTLTSNSRTEIFSLLRQCPINHKERQELCPLPSTFLRQPCAIMGQGECLSVCLAHSLHSPTH